MASATASFVVQGASAYTSQFNATSYVPQNLQDDYATGEAYYNQFSQAAQGTITVGSNGSVHVSDQVAFALADAVAGVVALAIPVLGTAFAVLMSIAPRAGAGPGECSTSPPTGPAPSQLTNWQYFTSWTSFYPPYSNAGGFESYANPVLEYNWLLQANCFSSQATSPAILLAALIASWNATHEGPPRVITRSGLVQQGFGAFPSGYDPIAEALETAILAQYSPANETFAQATSGTDYTGPYNTSSSFSINDGPHKTVLTLKLTQPSAASDSPTVAAAKTAVGVTAAAAGTVTLTAIIWALATGKAWDWAFSQAWAEIKEMIDGPAGLHEVAGGFMEELPIVSERQGTETQTLLFSRHKYDTASARAWARAHGYRSGKVDVTANYIRIRQKDPSRFRRLRTVPFSRDIKAVIGPLKE